VIRLRRGIPVAVSERIRDRGHCPSSPRRCEHVWLELKIPLLRVGRSITTGISRELTVKVEARERISSNAWIIRRRLWIRWCSVGHCGECVGYRRSRINSIIRLVVFACRRHGGDFGFATRERGFFPGVPNRT